MTDTQERPFITTVQVRAQDLSGGDLVKLQGVPVYTWLPPTPSESDGKWSNATIWQPGTWSLVYDVDNAQGDSSDETQQTLNEQFVLIRISRDEPNDVNYDDMHLVIQRQQLVLIQHENRNF